MDVMLVEKGEKRKRSSNFHVQEIQTLLVLVSKDRAIIESKKTDQSTNSQKEAAWKRIAHIFNQRNPTKRSDKQLRSKWETLKKNARKDHSSGKLTELSSNVIKVIESNEELDFVLEETFQLKEEPYYDELTYEDNEISSEMDQWSTSPPRSSQEFAEGEVEERHVNKMDLSAFQPKVEQYSSSNLGGMIFREIVPKPQTSSTSDISQNMQWKPITIAQAFVAPPALVLASPHADDEMTIKEKTSNISIVSPINTANSRNIVTAVTRGTQCDITEEKDVARRKRKSTFCCHFSSNQVLVSLQKKLLVEENKRKKEKHQTEMEILKIELEIKRKQLEDMK